LILMLSVDSMVFDTDTVARRYVWYWCYQ